LDLSPNFPASPVELTGKLDDSLFICSQHDTKPVEFKQNGGKYKGFGLHRTKDGFGVTEYDDGGSYNGKYVNGIKEGPGEFDYGNGALFKGFYKEGCKHGFGKYKRPDGIKFKGIWHHDILIDEIQAKIDESWQYIEVEQLIRSEIDKLNVKNIKLC
jgi:hypothetical protein